MLVNGTLSSTFFPNIQPDFFTIEVAYNPGSNENQTKERQADRSCIEVKGPGEIENSSTVTRVQIQENSSYQSSTNVLAINPAYGTNIANAP